MVYPQPKMRFLRQAEKIQFMQSLHDLQPSEQAKQGDELLKVAAKLLDRRKDYTDKDNYMMARGLLTSASAYRQGIERKGPIRRSQQSRLYLDKAQDTLKAVKWVTQEGVIDVEDSRA